MEFCNYLLFLLFGSIIYAFPPSEFYDPEEAIRTEFQLNLYDLQDIFDNKVEATKKAYLISNFENKERVEKILGMSFKDTKRYVSNFSDIPEDVRSKWLILSSPGDYALPEELWNQFVTFSNSLEKLREESVTNNGTTISKQTISNELETSHNLTALKTKWSTWRDVISQKQNNYSSFLQLLNNASEANDQMNVNVYWEMLSDYNDGYVQSEQLWNEIKPLYDTLRVFAKKRLYTYYNYSDEENYNETDTFPVYMTGSLLGDDWSNIADIILPRPYLLYDAKTFLHTKSSKQIFQHAETLATNFLGLPKINHKFWSSSTFNHTTCSNLLLTFCGDEYSEVITCNSTSWKQYLEAHEIVTKATLKNTEYELCPLTELRSSTFDEALVNFGSYFAINAMDKMGVVKGKKVKEDELNVNEDDIYQRDDTLLLLTALRVLPKLAFYFTVDKWRLEGLDRELEIEDLGERWEALRQEVQGLRGLTSEEYDFLNDEYVTSNKPYLSKFMGILLQFHIIEYFKTDYYIDEDKTLYDVITAESTTLQNTVADRLSIPWKELIFNNFGINEITAQPLLNYFAPLNDYLENVPTEFITPSPFTTEPPTISTTESLKRSAVITTDAAAPSDIIFTTTAVNQHSESTEKPTVKKFETTQQNAGMYVGLGILAIVAVVVVLVLVRNRLKRRRKNNNRRYET